MKFLIIFAAVLSFALSSCKKGDEDPFFTLASRKARISGEWKMTAYDRYYYNISTAGDTTSQLTAAGDDAIIIKDYSGSSSIQTETFKYVEYSMTINRDGTWLIVQDYDYRYYVDNSYATSSHNYHKKETQSGTWSFVKQTEGYKNKERVVLNILEESSERGERIDSTDYKDIAATDEIEIDPAYNSTNTYETGWQNIVYDLLMLKSKEMIWTLNSGGQSDSQTSIGVEKITWSLK